MTGIEDPVGAARRLAEQAPRVVVTMGPEGALELCDGELLEAGAAPHRVVDTTGAGDLFTAAYVWADLQGAESARTAALGGRVRVALGPRHDRGGRGGDRRGAGGGGRAARAGAPVLASRGEDLTPLRRARGRRAAAA